MRRQPPFDDRCHNEGVPRQGAGKRSLARISAEAMWYHWGMHRRSQTGMATRLAWAEVRARLTVRMAVSRARGRPHTLSHLVTARCNGSCATCLWRAGAGGESHELDTGAVRWLYEEAGRAGMAQVVVWGGEPLLRQDLPELLLAARRAGLFVTLITNGWLAAERWPELRGSVDALILSLDDLGEAHDRIRGLPGLFGRLEAFAASLSGDPLRPTLLLNSVLSRQNRGALRRVAAAARRWEAGLYFCPMETGELSAGEAGDRLAGLALPHDELREAAALALELKAAGCPILDSRAYLRMLADDPSLRAYTCRAPRARLTVGADGSVRDCMHVDRPLIDVASLRARGLPLDSLFRTPGWRRMGDEAASCTKCNNPDVVELSWLWDLRPVMLGKVLELAGR
jgi:MoaA/NifB/PqqE/SkfB family radical SAM enzyme